MKAASHIPQMRTITDFYRQLRIGEPQGDDVAIMRIEDQPPEKRLEMPLFRCNFYRLVLFTNPGVEFRLSGQRLQSSENSLYFAYPGKLESWHTSQKIFGWLLCFTGEFAQFDSLHSAFAHTYPYFDFEAPSLLSFNETQTQGLSGTLDSIHGEMHSGLPDKKEMIRHYLHQLLIQVRRLFLEEKEKASGRDRNGSSIFNRFQRELDGYFVELAEGRAGVQASVSLLAERVFLNPSYLNTVLKEVTGKTASQHIREKTALEAKSYLMHTDLRIADVSHRLGFAHISYFNRYFKQSTGLAPSSFRKRER